MTEVSTSDLGVNTIEGFHGVYLLVNQSDKFKGRTYIGYTVDPNRREKQHNGGVKAGGARKTHNKGEWQMVLIIHGFPNEISALRFEWAWTHPKRSRRLRDLTGKLGRESPFEYRFRVLSHMLMIGPWKRLPLTIRWLNQDFRKEFPPELQPPTHMPVVFGPVTPVSLPKESTVGEKKSVSTVKQNCPICHKLMSDPDHMIRCLVSECSAPFHIYCLAEAFLGEEKETELIPVEGDCPACHTHMLWGDLVIHKKGGYVGGVSLPKADLMSEVC